MRCPIPHHLFLKIQAFKKDSITQWSIHDRGPAFIMEIRPIMFYNEANAILMLSSFRAYMYYKFFTMFTRQCRETHLCVGLTHRYISIMINLTSKPTKSAETLSLPWTYAAVMKKQWFPKLCLKRNFIFQNVPYNAKGPSSQPSSDLEYASHQRWSTFLQAILTEMCTFSIGGTLSMVP